MRIGGSIGQSWENIKKNPGAAAGGAAMGGALGGVIGIPLAVGGGAAATANQAQANREAKDRINGLPVMTPAQSAAARDADIRTGQQRWRQLFDTPEIGDIKKRRLDLTEGLNSQEMQAARELMVKEQQGQAQGLMRSLLSQQRRSGVQGGLAGSQQNVLARQIAADHANAEKKLLLDNFTLKNQGLDKYQDFIFRDKFGELSQGLGEAGLGVADRTGYLQALIGQAMAQSANQKSPGFFSIFNPSNWF